MGLIFNCWIVYTGYTQKNGAVSKVNKKCVSHLTREQRTRQQQQLASHAYCGAAGPVSKMALQQEKAFCVLRFEVSRSVITVQRGFRARFRKHASCRNSITRRYRQFVGNGCLCKGKSPGPPRLSDDIIERVREAFLWSPRKSVARASRKLDMPKMTVWKLRNTFLAKFWNRIILLCILCIFNCLNNIHIYNLQIQQFRIIKPTRCTNFSDLFLEETLHVSDSSSVHHQEFFTVHTTGRNWFRPDCARKLSANLYDTYPCCVYSEKLFMMDRGTVRNM